MLSAGIEKNLIYDVGLNNGEDSEFYLKKGFRVVAIEALPALAEAARERLHGYVESGQLTILNLAVAEKDGPLDFYISENDGLSSACPDSRGHRGNLVKTTVQGSRFSNVLARYGAPYFLKVDIEGLDILCLQALREFDSRPKYV
ncbi:MAG: FkbM family methyltransferase, partial [Terracidiphilus sp.]